MLQTRPARWHGVTWTHSPSSSQTRPRTSGESLGKSRPDVGESRAAFDEAEREAKEKAELAKAAEKVDDSARTFCINQEITSRVLDCPLASYERKDDLAAAIGAFTLPMDIIVDS